MAADLQSRPWKVSLRVGSRSGGFNLHLMVSNTLSTCRRRLTSLSLHLIFYDFFLNVSSEVGSLASESRPMIAPSNAFQTARDAFRCLWRPRGNHGMIRTPSRDDDCQSTLSRFWDSFLCVRSGMDSPASTQPMKATTTVFRSVLEAFRCFRWGRGSHATRSASRDEDSKSRKRLTCSRRDYNRMRNNILPSLPELLNSLVLCLRGRRGHIVLLSVSMVSTIWVSYELLIKKSFNKEDGFSELQQIVFRRYL